jgi:transposase
MRAALNDLAVIAPEWLQALAPPEWYPRYGRRVENYHLPKTDTARDELARVIAADGERLLAAVDAATDQPVLAQISAVLTLRRVWAEQYTGAPGQLHWREVKDMPSPAELISSPYDTEARYSTKRQMEWVGYKVHFTETCDEDRPHLIVNVETTPATTPDDNMIEEVHESLEPHDRLPGEHLVDKGYTDAKVLVDSQREYGVTIVGPVAEDPSWQARAGEGFDKGSFAVDWEKEVVTCPAGKTSISWLPNTYPPSGMAFEARFARKDCTPCPFRGQCTRSKQEPRIIGLLPREQHEALQAARGRQETEEFRQQYAARAGIEGTHEQAVRRCGLRRCRYIGQARAHLQHVLTAAALNIIRLDDWWAGSPVSRTRCSRFAALELAA